MVKKRKTKTTSNSFRGFIPTGKITYQNQVYDIFLSQKTGELAFFQNGQWIEDPTLVEKLIQYLLEANQ